MNFIAKALNLSRAAAERLQERNILRRACIKHNFFPDIVEAYRLDKKFGFYEEGTVIVKSKDGEVVIRGFPKIRRALTLKPTLEKHFGKRKIALEEKMNGYNVRIVKIGENLYAVTRRGLICPYTTEKVREKIPNDFFEEYPNYMLCCEAVGYYSPYVPSKVYGLKEIEFFLFDVRESRTNRPIEIKEKVEIAERYGFNLARILAEILPDEIEVVRKIINELNRFGREGIVFKDLKMEIEPIKYTTSSANCSDLRYAFRYFSEYARDFMLARIVREAFQSFEFDDQEAFDERCKRLGRSILEPMVNSIKTVKSGESVAEVTKLVFYSEEVLELFKNHLKLLGVDFRIKEFRRTGSRIYVIFERIMRSTTDKIKNILNGGLWK